MIRRVCFKRGFENRQWLADRLELHYSKIAIGPRLQRAKEVRMIDDVEESVENDEFDPKKPLKKSAPYLKLIVRYNKAGRATSVECAAGLVF